MLDVEIQPAIPIPVRIAGGAQRVYPLNNLKVGDSFEVPISKKRSLRASASMYAKRHGVKFKTRTMGKGKNQTVRVWRVK